MAKKNRFEQCLRDFRICEMDFRINDLNEAPEVKLNGEWVIIDKTIEAVIRTELRELGYGVQGSGKANRMATEEAWITLAHKQRYNPIKNYFDDLRDMPYEPKLVNTYPEPYLITEFCLKYFDCVDLMWGPWVFRWMVGCIAKLHKQERNPILVMGGPQDMGKSRFVRWLAPLEDHFREGPIRPDDKDERVRLSDTFIQEIPELGNSTRRTDIEAFKEHITRQFVHERPAYARGPMRKPAVCSFLATVNLDGAGFLVDTTGSTRFLISVVNTIDFDYDKTDPRLLWREALWFFDETYRSWELNHWEKERRDEINAQYQMVSALSEVIDQYLEITDSDDDWLATVEIRDYLKPYYRIGSENGFFRELSRTLSARGLLSGREPYKKGRPHRMGWFRLRKRAIDLNEE